MNREEIIKLSNEYKTPQENEQLRQSLADLNNIDHSKHTIVFSSPGRSGTQYFRIEESLLSIYRNCEDFNLILTEQINPTHFNLASLIVVHRAGDAHTFMHELFKLWPSHKIRPYLIHNVDDNEINLPKTHPMYQMWMAQKRDKQSFQSISESDGVEITGRKLKTLMSNHNRNVWITRNRFNWKLPQWNCIKRMKFEEFYPQATDGSVPPKTDEKGITEPESAYNQKKHYSIPDSWADKIIIGWAGLTSHFEDIKKMAPILKAIYEKYPNVVFVLAGMALRDTMYQVQQDPKTGRLFVKEEEILLPDDQKYRNKVAKIFEFMDPERIRIFDALPLEQYGWFYSLFDIGIAYIEHNKFNESKSEIKVVEYFKYGSPTVFSNYGGYNDLYQIMTDQKVLDKNILNKMVCNNEFAQNEWIANLSYWVENFGNETFNTASKNIKSFVENEYDIDKHIFDQIIRYKNAIEENIENQQLQQFRLISNKEEIGV